MAYTLKKSDGSILVTLPDQQSDNESTSLTLIGKNVNAYGTDLNDNFVRHLENFAYTVAPSNPLTGQIWYDTIEQRIKVQTIAGDWKPVGGPTISATEPVSLSIGDLWYDSTAKQLKFVDASENLVIIGPMYDSTVGKSGWVTEDVLKSSLTSATVSNLYSNNILLGILSDTSFTLANNTLTGSTLVGVGFNTVWNATSKVKFIGTATIAEALYNSSTNSLVYADQFLNSASAIVTNNSVKIFNDDPAGSLIVGSDQDFQFFSTTSTLSTATLFLAGQGKDYNISINPDDLSGETSVLHFDSNGAGALGIFNTTPTEKVDIIGNVKIQGDLFVYGTSTYIQSQDLQVIDKNIELAVVPDSTNDTADGGGIIIQARGASSNPLYASIPIRDKEIKWYESSPSNGFNTWSVTDNLELRFADSSYLIWGSPVLSRTALGATVTESNLTTLGNLTNLTAARLTFGIENGTYPLTSPSTSTTIGISGVTTATMVIGDNNTFEIDFAGKRLLNVETPREDASSPSNQVATKGYVDGVIDLERNGRYALSLDVTSVTGAYGPSTLELIDDYVISYLQILYPTNLGPVPANTRDGTMARVVCTKYVTSATNAISTQADNGTPLTIDYIDHNGNPQVAEVIEYFPKYQFITPIPETGLRVYKVVKAYIVSGEVWIADGGRGSGNILYTEGTW